MSWKAEAWVQAHPQIITQMEFCVMMNFANWANDKFEWAPSHSTWARAARCSVISVRRTVDHMIRLGLVTVVEHGRNKPNRYRLNVADTGLPSLVPDEPEQVVLARIEKESRDPQLRLVAHDEHPDCPQVAHGEQLPPAHDEQPVAHLDERAVAHLDERRTITTTSYNREPPTEAERIAARRAFASALEQDKR
jgi:hypothetical protein